MSNTKKAVVLISLGVLVFSSTAWGRERYQRGGRSSGGSHQYRTHAAPRNDRIRLDRSSRSSVSRYSRGRGTVRSRSGIVRDRVYRRDNRTYVRRTYSRHNHAVQHHYRPHYRGHRVYYSYAPHYVYSSHFYGWVGRPWAPRPYGWWWYDEPWVRHYGYYWRPYPVYYGPAFWITDFVVADILAREYANDRVDAARAEARSGISDEMKAEIRSQVEEELRAHQKKQSVPIDKTLKKNYLHVISDDMDVAVVGSDESCSLTSGDIVKVSQRPGKDDDAARMTVVTSKKGSCAPKKQVLVSLNDIQEMKNNFSETVDRGLSKLSEEQGKGGLPAAPENDR